ncbi:MAG: PEP-CTERM sorting domain-containing protein [Bryobacteraceae bacterium]|jgi:hypothetical protein
MKMFRGLIKGFGWAAALVAVLCLAPGTAHATMVCTQVGASGTTPGSFYNPSISECDVVFTYLFSNLLIPTAATQNLNLETFNTNWGTIDPVTGVQIGATVTASVSDLLSNSSGSATDIPTQDVVGTASIKVAVTGPTSGPPTNDGNLAAAIASISFCSSDSHFTGANPCHIPGIISVPDPIANNGSYTVSGSASSPSLVENAPGAFAPYESVGNSTFLVTVTGQGLDSITKPSGTSSVSSGTANGSVVVEYEYVGNAAPEPLTLSLLGSGLIAMGFLGRKRFVKK